MSDSSSNGGHWLVFNLFIILVCTHYGEQCEFMTSFAVDATGMARILTSPKTTCLKTALKLAKSFSLSLDATPQSRRQMRSGFGSGSTCMTKVSHPTSTIMNLTISPEAALLPSSLALLFWTKMLPGCKSPCTKLSTKTCTGKDTHYLMTIEGSNILSCADNFGPSLPFSAMHQLQSLPNVS